ncbi:MAG: hypothetical protein AAFR04_11710 [Pseudomonadota bacterium]
MVAALCVPLGACGISSLTSGIGGSVFGGSQKKTQVRQVTPESLLSAAKSDANGGPAATGIALGCPSFEPWPRDNTLTIYEPGRSGEGLAIIHRGEITKTARECQIEPGRITVKYGFSGRVLLGPRGQPGIVTLPINVFVTDASRARLRTETMQVQVPVALDKPIGYFSTVRTVSFEIPQGVRPADFKVYVGFKQNAPGAG